MIWKSFILYNRFEVLPIEKKKKKSFTAKSYISIYYLVNADCYCTEIVRADAERKKMKRKSVELE